MKLKKFILSIAFFGIFSFAFARNFFSDRFFEIQLSVPFDFSNNAFSLNDILQKEAVIDLTEIAKSLPNEGFALTAKAKPEFGFNVNIGVVNAGLHFGFDIYEKMGISKGLFDFLGTGNEIGETIDVEFKNNTDIFLTGECSLGIKAKKFSFSIKPGVFIPVLSASGSVLKADVLNNENGDISVTMSTDMNVYSNINFTDISEEILNDIAGGMGFDLGGTVSVPLNKKFTVSGDARVPIKPGSYKYYIPNISFEKNIKMNIPGIIGSSEDSDSAITESGDDLDFSSMTIEELEKKVNVNRPMKFHAYAAYSPVLGLLEFCGGGGLGIYHPFMDDYFLYPEYYFSAGVNFLNILKAKLSTEYTDQIFKHQISADVNLRLIEIECGFSLQSTSFVKSMSVTGLGAYVILSFGF